MRITLHTPAHFLRRLHPAAWGQGADQHVVRRIRFMGLAWALGLAALLGMLPAAQAQVGTWAIAGELTDARVSHTATLLNNGGVLVVGGENRAPDDVSGVLVGSVELYSPLSNSWITVPGTLLARRKHTATLLGNGDVLVAGGSDSTGAINSVQLFASAMAAWQNASNLTTARTGHTATLLNDGTVLVAGGQTTGDTYLASAERYDPATDTWAVVAGMAVAREGHTATLLANGKVLVAGGTTTGGTALASAEVYDPLTGTWSAAGAMDDARVMHTATLLPSGLVLVTGGFDGSTTLDSAALFNPTGATWAPASSMHFSVQAHTATLLTDGTVLVAGGWDNGAYQHGYLYTPGTDSWGDGDDYAVMNWARGYHTATRLQNGKVLVAGGLNSDGAGGAREADLFTLGAVSTATTVTGINPANGPTLGNTSVTISGTAFTGATSATVCGVDLGSLVVLNDTTLTGVTPAHVAALCNVVVSSPAGDGTATGLFSYMKVAQTLAFGAAPVVTLGGPAGTVTANSTEAALNTLTTFTSLSPTTCAVSGSSVTALASGACTVAANNPGNGSYAAAAQVTQIIAIPTPLRIVTGTPPGASAITASFVGGNAGCGYESAHFPSAAAVGGALPAEYAFDKGGFGFTTTQCGTGATLTLTLTFDQPFTAGTKLFKFNGTTWAEFPADIIGNTVTYTVTDGGAGDSNTADGVITDPVAVGVPLPTAVAGAPVPVPTLGQWALVLLSLMAAALGMGVLRRQTSQGRAGF